jgi:hypothetical protein
MDDNLYEISEAVIGDLKATYKSMRVFAVTSILVLIFSLIYSIIIYYLLVKSGYIVPSYEIILSFVPISFSFYFTLNLYKASSKLKLFTENKSPKNLEEAFLIIRSYWRNLALFVIVGFISGIILGVISQEFTP